MFTVPDTFTCVSCGKSKDSFFLFYAKGQTMCLWCAEDHGLTKPNTRRPVSRMRRY
jgi:transcription elongation factor Elf1